MSKIAKRRNIRTVTLPTGSVLILQRPKELARRKAAFSKVLSKELTKERRPPLAVK